jgi:uncharacterized protein YcfJ
MGQRRRIEAVKNTHILIGVTTALLLLGGCASSGGSRHSRVTETERTYRDRGQVCRETEVVERDRSDNDNRVAGTVAGAVVGGVIGHQVGSGRGNDAATVGGAAAGAYAGNQIAKDRGGSVRRSEVTRECSRSRY